MAFQNTNKKKIKVFQHILKFDSKQDINRELWRPCHYWLNDWTKMMNSLTRELIWRWNVNEWRCCELRLSRDDYVARIKEGRDFKWNEWNYEQRRHHCWGVRKSQEYEWNWCSRTTREGDTASQPKTLRFLDEYMVSLSLCVTLLINVDAPPHDLTHQWYQSLVRVSDRLFMSKVFMTWWLGDMFSWSFHDKIMMSLNNSTNMWMKELPLEGEHSGWTHTWGEACWETNVSCVEK